MFCKNCGQQMSDDSKFCGNCGTNVNREESSNIGNTFDIKETISEIGAEFISLVKNPVNTVRESKNKNNNTYMIFGLLATILAVLNVYIYKSVFVKAIGGSFANEGINYLLKGKHFGIVLSLLISNIAIIAVSAAVVFLALNVVLKKSSFTYFDGLKVMIAGYTYSTIIIFIGTIISYIYLPLGAILIGISIIAYMILVYEGIKSFEIVDNNICLYIVLIVMISIMIIQYLIITNQISKLTKGFRLDPTDILQEFLF